MSNLLLELEFQTDKKFKSLFPQILKTNSEYITIVDGAGFFTTTKINNRTYIDCYFDVLPDMLKLINQSIIDSKENISVQDYNETNNDFMFLNYINGEYSSFSVVDYSDKNNYLIFSFVLNKDLDYDTCAFSILDGFYKIKKEYDLELEHFKFIDSFISCIIFTTPMISELYKETYSKLDEKELKTKLYYLFEPSFFVKQSKQEIQLFTIENNDLPF